MKAALVRDPDRPPSYGDFNDPQSQPDEVLIDVRAAALTQLSRGQASGKHYSATAGLPFVPGADGVGTLPTGERVYFAFPRAPFGSMAGRSVVKRSYCAVVPPELDDVSAAALGNPGMSSWVALTLRAGFRAGERVLVNGATGASGRLALRIARHLGASRIVATGRDESSQADTLAFGADAFVPLNQPPEALLEAFRDEIHGGGVDVVLDYLWGPSASSIIAATASRGGGVAAPRIRFVQIGAMAGDSIPLGAGALRSSAIELLGSGLGSASHDALVRAIAEMFRAATAGGFAVDALPVPLADVEAAWSRGSTQRIVFTI